MLLRLALPTALVLLMLAASVADAFEGQLIDRRTNRPIAGAEVAIGGVAGTVRTGQDGRFTWTPDPAPPFVIVIILPGGQLAKPVRVSARPHALLVIQVDPSVDEHVTVTGSAPSVEAPPGAAAAMVTSPELVRRAPLSLVDAMEDVNGVSRIAEGHSAVPAIRGLARGRTLMLVDGTRLFSERRAGPSVTFLAPDTFDRIDIVRGPVSVAYGSDAFGGVVSVITKQAAAGAPFAAQLIGAFGAGVPARRADAEVSSGLGARAGILAQARHRSSGDYSSPDGAVPNSAWQDSGGLVRATFSAGGWWTASWQSDWVGASGLPRSDVATLVVSNPFERSQRAVIAFDRSGVPWLDHVSVNGFVGTYAQRLDQDRVPAPGRPRRIDRSDIDGTDAQLRAIARTGLGRLRLTTGIDATSRHDLRAHDIAIVFNAAGDVTSTTDSASIASARKRDVGAFAQVDAPVGSWLTVAAGARFDAVRSVNAGGFFGDRTVSQGAPSGSVSIAARPWSPLTITAQAARGFRDPTLSDRFYRGPVGRGFIIGNPDLEPERSVQFDVTARYDGGRWRASASYYHYDIADLIERYQAGTDTFLFRNRGLAQIRGVEAEAAFDAGRSVTLNVSAQAGRGRAKDDDAALDDIAPASVLLQVQKAFGASVFVSARAEAFARDSAPGPSEIATPGYVDAGAIASWRVVRHLELHVAASNLLNQRSYSSPSPRWVLAPGRQATVTVVVRY